MFSKIIKCVAIIIAMAPLGSHADWTTDQQVGELYVHINAVVIKLAANPANTGCVDNSYLTLEPGKNPLFKEQYAMLLAAKMSAKAVDIFLEGCGIAQPAHPKVTYVRVK